MCLQRAFPENLQQPLEGARRKFLASFWIVLFDLVAFMPLPAATRAPGRHPDAEETFGQSAKQGARGTCA